MAVDPSALRIVSFPDPVLRRRAAVVERVEEWHRAVAGRMLELMREAEGIGLAAPQVGLGIRLFVVDVEESGAEHAVYFNPRIVEQTGDLVAKEEGCLSLPNIRAEIRRPPQVRIVAWGPDGREFSAAADGLLARVWQHESDHLDGVLILDRMTPIDRIATRRAVKELLAAGEK